MVCAQEVAVSFINPPPESTPPMQVGVRELRGNLTRYLREARQGASILVTSNDTVIAELRAPPAQARAPRQPGALRGQIVMAEEFDTLPTDVLAAMEE
jgi:antitoxin (DNA-binding transcriptional repressor) of toxin-antitoxin stability system